MPDEPTPTPATADAALPDGVTPSTVTIITTLATTILPLIPGVGPVLSGLFGANPHLMISLLGAIFSTLHFAHTKGWVK